MSWVNLKFNDKYKEFVLESLDSTFIVAEGSWRAGKTVAILTAHCIFLDDLDISGLHIIGAESISTARTILLDNPTGFSYKSFFAERAEEKQFEGKDALQIINSKGQKQILIFVGTSKSNSWQSIRGFSVISTLITEVNIAHKQFLEELIGRTIATPKKYRKLFFDLNPAGETNWFYLEFLNKWQDQMEKGEFNLTYQHFTFMDNISIEEEDRRVILEEYDKDSVVYKAFILGQRITQADNIFRITKANLVSDLPKPEQYVIAVDPGISTSSTVFIVLGIHQKQMFIYDFYHHKNGRGIEQKDVKEYTDYAQDLVDFTLKQKSRFGEMPRYVLLDNDISFLRISRNIFMKNNLGASLLKFAVKDKIDDRILLLSSLLHTGQIKISDNLNMVIKAIEDAVYDPKELQKSGKLIRYDKPREKKEEINPVDIVDSIDYAVSWAVRRIKGIEF